MAKRVLVASGQSSTVPSTDTAVQFPSGAPSQGNIWNDRVPKADNDVRIMASLSASGNYSMRLMASFTDPSTGSSYNGIIEQFAPGDTIGNGTGQEVFRSAGKHVHFEWLEIQFSSTGEDLTVNQLGVVWESA